MTMTTRVWTAYSLAFWRAGVEEPPTRDNVLRTEGNGKADLSRVNRLDNCVECFAECHRRLTEEPHNNNNNKSLLCRVLDHERLQQERETASRRAKRSPRRSPQGREKAAEEDRRFLGEATVPR